jgi:hypothetical protein
LYLASSSNLDNYVGGPKSTTKNMESVLKGIILFLIMFIAAMFLWNDLQKTYFYVKNCYKLNKYKFFTISKI